MTLTAEQIEARNEWADALEFDGYMQCQKQLRKVRGEEKSYCCLGVGQELFGPHEWSNGTVYGMVSSVENYPSTLVRQKLGLELQEMRYLADLNDNVGKNFTEIAKVVRNDTTLAALRANKG